jgi:hypothetical protein
VAKIRRAHKDLNWVLERRTAQIANFRRDRKNEVGSTNTLVPRLLAHSVPIHQSVSLIN